MQINVAGMNSRQMNSQLCAIFLFNVKHLFASSIWACDSYIDKIVMLLI